MKMFQLPRRIEHDAEHRSGNMIVTPWFIVVPVTIGLLVIDVVCTWRISDAFKNLDKIFGRKKDQGE